MRQTLTAFFQRVPNISALRLSYLCCVFIPALWLHDEGAYTSHYQVVKTAQEEYVTWHKLQDSNPETSPWCILSFSHISPSTVKMIGLKTSMIDDTGSVVATGSDRIDLNRYTACEGVSDDNILWLSFGKTHADLRQDFLAFNVAVWSARLFFLYIMGVAIGNVMNRRFARRDSEVLREYTLRYLKYRKQNKAPSKLKFWKRKSSMKS